MSDVPRTDDDDALAVGRAADLLGVTIRTLHHWDGIGLARPSARSAAGYRLYDAGDLERLRRIVLYRELGLGLDRIRRLLDAPGDALAALRDQRAQVTAKLTRLSRLADGLDGMIDAHERGVRLSASQQAGLFGDGWDPRWQTEAASRYAGTAEWLAFAERSAERSPQEWEAVAAETSAFERTLADAMGEGVAPGSPAADALADRHREVFSAFFPLSAEMQVCLVRRFATDPGFAAHYDRLRPGLADWFRSIVDERARAAGIDPDTAVWR